jgi:hypothetical protein
MKNDTGQRIEQIITVSISKLRHVCTSLSCLAMKPAQVLVCRQLHAQALESLTVGCEVFDMAMMSGYLLPFHQAHSLLSSNSSTIRHIDNIHIILAGKTCAPSSCQCHQNLTQTLAPSNLNQCRALCTLLLCDLATTAHSCPWSHSMLLFLFVTFHGRHCCEILRQRVRKIKVNALSDFRLMFMFCLLRIEHCSSVGVV